VISFPYLYSRDQSKDGKGGGIRGVRACAGFCDSSQDWGLEGVGHLSKSAYLVV
jgi:hypothetical protein